MAAPVALLLDDSPIPAKRTWIVRFGDLRPPLNVDHHTLNIGDGHLLFFDYEDRPDDRVQLLRRAFAPGAWSEIEEVVVQGVPLRMH